MTNSEFKTFKARTGLTVSEGNKKLKPIKDTCNFLIFNIPAVKTCPYATEHCKQLCYALKAERVYPSARAARDSNYNASLKNDFVNNMLELIAHYMSKPKYKNIPCFFRVHEAGDFYSKDYLNKWLEIFKACSELYPNLYFNCYTKSVPFLEQINYTDFKAMYKNVVFNISLWDDSPVITKEFIKKYNYPVYTAAAPDQFASLLQNPNNKKCKCADCGKCRLCLIGNKPLTKICEIH